MTERDENGRPKDAPVNTAPDAVKDPNEKTDGKPGAGQKGQNDEIDPGGS